MIRAVEPGFSDDSRRQAGAKGEHNRSRLPNNFMPAALIVLLALVLNFYGIDFPRGYHIDEGKKFGFVKNMNPDFLHPILMLQSARLLYVAVRPAKDEHFFVLCRSVSAVSGALIALIFFFLVRARVALWLAVVSSVGLASSPIMVCHAHYFKEDMIFTCCALLTLWALWRFAKEPGNSSALLLGLCFGLAVSAQYKGMILFLVVLVTPLIIRETEGRRFYIRIPVVTAAAAAVFILVNYPIFSDPDVFRRGLCKEVMHALGERTLDINPGSNYLLFHWIHSIAPGTSWPLAVFGLLGLSLTVYHWRTLSGLEKLLVVYFLLFYFSHELSKLKPYPDFGRYMIPVIPALFYFIALLLHRIGMLDGRKGIYRISIGLFATFVALALYDSCLLGYYMTRDTRAEAQRIVDSSGKKAMYERYAGPRNDVMFLGDLDLDKVKSDGVELLVGSSFNYERFYYSWAISGQKNRTDRRRKMYDSLFSLPYEEIRPAHRTYGFSNPVIRIIDVGGGGSGGTGQGK